MTRPNLDQYYAGMLALVASRATCPRRCVGAILVDEDGKLVSMGYNGTPAHMAHCTEVPCAGARDPGGDTSRCIAIHAEVNAIMQAADSRRKPHTLYCSTTPCFNCAKLLISAGVYQVVALSIYEGDLNGVELLEEAGIDVFIYRDGQRDPWKKHA